MLLSVRWGPTRATKQMPHHFNPSDVGTLLIERSDMKRYMRIFASAVMVFGVALLGTVAAPIGAGATTGTVFAPGYPAPTTMDACSAFSAMQTSSQSNTVTTKNGTLSYYERGTWDELTQNWGTPISPLPTPAGTYTEQYSVTASGSFTGTEEFQSSVGNVAQQYSYSASAGWTVNVVATGSLSFLTSNTNGNCY